MKRWFAALLAVCLLLSGCGASSTEGGEDAETAWTSSQIAWAVWKGQTGTPERSEGLSPEDPGFADYLTAYYRLDPETVEDGYIRYAGGMDAFELAVLRFREGTDMEEAESALRAYQDARAGDFTGYLPEQAALAEAGTVAICGCWAALLLCPRPEAELFLACFGPDAPDPETPDWPDAPQDPPEEPAEEEPAEPVGEGPEETEGDAEIPEETEEPAEEQAEEKPEPEEVPEQETPPAPEETEASGEQPAPEETPAAPNLYDGEAVRSAWRSGDSSGLSEKSLAVLNAAGDVLSQTVTEEMSMYEKELAIHDWMVAWGSYDHDTLSHLEGDGGTPDNENPYGFLVNKKGICLGYASTFQLFMDLLGIPCRTVYGTAHRGTADHAWNLVQLDEEWYGVDVTWDDPSGTTPSARTAHRYFNVTSQHLRDNDHQWDPSGIPEAEGTAFAWTEESDT